MRSAKIADRRDCRGQFDYFADKLPRGWMVRRTRRPTLILRESSLRSSLPRSALPLGHRKASSQQDPVSDAGWLWTGQEIDGG